VTKKAFSTIAVTAALVLSVAAQAAQAAPHPATFPATSPPPKFITVTVRKPIPFPTRTVPDASLAVGVTHVRTQGVAGIRTLAYRITYTGHKQTSKTLLRSSVTRQPTTKVVAVGTRAARQCDPNYSGCVPIASDVDCSTGSGNGPAYVTGPVQVIGTDIYGLDNDGDGIGCEQG
jgi:hypothetical protein